MAERKGIGVFRHPSGERGYCVRSECLTTTCSQTKPKQRIQPITGLLSARHRLSLAERGNDVGTPRLYTFARPSWISVFIFAFCLICHVQCEHSARTTSSENSDIKTCERQDNCQKLSTTMGHTQNTESLQFHQLQTMLAKTQRLWVFGYGSLVWKTGFSFTTKKTGYVTGYLRRFWQGDSTHRGTASAPGRTATLEEDKSGLVWGVAFELVGRHQIETALEHLGLRECAIGGYSMKLVDFYPFDREGTPDNQQGIPNQNEGNPLQTLIFIATPENSNYLGKASIRDLGNQILNSRGHAGHNVEYVTRLADFLRDQVPGYHGDQVDSHLEELDRYLRRSLQEGGVDLQSLFEGALREDYSYMYKQGVHSDVVHHKGVHQERVHEEDGCQDGRGL